jgi:dimethylhistidine N-methyltransferase
MSTRHSAASQAADAAVKDFAADVQYYLTLQPRQLPSRYFYDALGSTLFEAICELPWYRITRAELALLEEHGPSVFAHARGASRLIELGPGNGAKLRTLVGSVPPRGRRLALHLVDVSASALDRAAHTLESLDSVDIVTHASPYEIGLRAATADALGGGRTLVLFLGSNIGNFDRPGADAFLWGIRSTLRRGDMLLIGADLVKPERDLLLAYDDPLGVTAAFNRNLLVRINAELGGEVDLDGFAHRAVWNEAESRVEMHLVSRRTQEVRIPPLEIEFTIREGETIWTESSYKYTPSVLSSMLEHAGFRSIEQWIAHEPGFALTLAEVR